MNNENELHDVTFKIRYPSKKEKILYAVKSILIDELNILQHYAFLLKTDGLYLKKTMY